MGGLFRKREKVTKQDLEELKSLMIAFTKAAEEFNKSVDRSKRELNQSIHRLNMMTTRPTNIDYRR